MLTRWTLENFKPFLGPLDLPIRPVTVFAGLNSSGKSSLLQAILMVAQTMRHPSRDRALVLNGSLVQLGSVAKVRNDRARTPGIAVGFEVDFRAQPKTRYIGKPKVISAWARALPSATVDEGPESTSLVFGEGRYHVAYADQAPLLSVALRALSPEERAAVLLADDDDGPFNASALAQHEDAAGSSGYGPALWAEMMHFIPVRLRPRNNSGRATPDSFSVEQYFSTSIRYIGPLRAAPQAAKGFAPSDEPDDVGPSGEYAAACFDANKDRKLRFYDPHQGAVIVDTLAAALDLWARYLGVGHHIATEDGGQAGVFWNVQTSQEGAARPLHYVGVGVSQVLPVLVAGLLAPPGTTLLMEQPELHLHARAQARLGDFFYGLARCGKQCIVETHSDCLIKQLRYHLVADAPESREQIAVYFVEQDAAGEARATPIEIGESGAILNWPDGFCDEAIKQEDDIVRASVKARARRPDGKSG